MNREVFAAVADALERGESAALVTIVATTGSTPQRVGAKMLVFGDGRIVGTIGGGCYENDAFWKAREAIKTRRPEVVHYELCGRFRAGDGSHLRRPDGRVHRADRAVARAVHHRRRARRVSPGASGRPKSGFACTSWTTARNSRTRNGFRRRPRSSWTTFPRGLTARISRRTPTPSSSRAATRTISKRCARSRRASCATSG